MKTLKIALLMDTARAYEQGLVRGISRCSLRHGPWQFLRQMPLVSGGQVRVGSQQVRQWGAQGLLLREYPGMQRLLDLGLPAVVAPYTRPYAGQANILTHDEAIGRMGAEHLRACGFRYFAFVGMGDGFYWSAGRARGFRTALSQAGFDAGVLNLPVERGAVHWSTAERRLDAWLRTLPKPAGVMVCNDDICLHVLEACKAAALDIPDRLGILGVGNDEMICTLTSPPLSSIALGTERAGFDAARWLEAAITAGLATTPTFRVDPLHVVARQSTDALTIEDPLVRRALRHIRDHVHRGLTVADLLRNLPVSRSALYQRFTRVMGHSPHEAIRRTRMARVAQLLVDTDLSITEIAQAVGFPDQKNLARDFRQVRGRTPLQYRRLYRLGERQAPRSHPPDPVEPA